MSQKDQQDEPTAIALLRQSEQRYRTLAESTCTIVWQIDPTGRHPKPSPSWEAFTGQSSEDWTGGRGAEVVHPDDRARLAETWRVAVASSRKFVTEYRLRRHDGVYVPMAVRGVPVLNDDGSIREWVGSSIDITARLQLLDSERAARKEAEATRQRMALLDSITKALVGELQGAAAPVEKLAQMVVPALADWCVVYLKRDDGPIEVIAVAHTDPQVVQAAQRMLARYPLKLDLGWGVPYVLRTGESELVTDVTDELLRAAAHDDEHFQLMRMGGMRAHMAVPLKARGQVIGCVGLTQSVSGRSFTHDDRVLAEEIGVRAVLILEQARLYKEARDARAEAEAANQAKDVFLAMLGHELRNPLAPIRTALGLLRLRGSEDSQRERAVIDRQVRHLEQLVDDLLDVSRITRGKIDLAREPLDIADVITKAIEMASPLLEQQKHHLRVDVAHRGLRVAGDHSRLAQVFANLLTNAAKYTRPGGRIVITALLQDNQVVVSVEDNGEGIDAQLLPRVFDLFTQGDRTLDRSQGGLGLGLAIVRSLVALHGGKVSAHSHGRGCGSRFVVRLPLCAPAPSEESARSLPKEVPVSAPGWQNTQLLIVDDNEDAALLLAEALMAVGHDVEVAHDGPSGLAAAARKPPAIALLDLGLPLMDGYELAQKLRASFPRIALVAITGYGQDSDREQSRAAGFQHHLVKPVELEHLVRILKELQGRLGLSR